MTSRTRARIWLSAGAAVGLAVALHGLFARGGALPPGAVAMVGEAPIGADEYARALAAVEADRRDPPDAALRRHVLERLIDEELLVSAALESGLGRRDPLLRGQLAAAMLDAVLGQGATPTEAELRAHFDAHPGLFTRNGRVRVQALWFAENGSQRAEDARARLRLGAASVVGDPPALVVPTAPIPQGKLADYLGARVAAAVATLPVGEVSAPIASGTGAWLVRVLERLDGEVPPFDAVRDAVAMDLRRARDDEALRRWLSRRRMAVRVVVGAPPP